MRLNSHPHTGHEFRARLFERSLKRNESGELQCSAGRDDDAKPEEGRKPKTTDTKKEADAPVADTLPSPPLLSSPLHGVCHFQFLVLLTVTRIRPIVADVCHV